MRKDGSLSLLDKNPVLRNKEFLCLIFFRFGIFFVLNLQSTAIYYWVYQITGSNLKMGMIGLSEVVPAILFSMISGYIIDMQEKKKMLLLCVVGYSVLSFGLSVLSIKTSLDFLGLNKTLICIFSLIFFGGILRAFLAPSIFALTSLVIPREQYINSTNWSNLFYNIGVAFGPLSFGIINTIISLFLKKKVLSTVGQIHAIPSVTDSMFFSFCIELVLIISIILIKAKPFMKKEKKEPIGQSLSLGVKFIWNTKALLGAQALDMFTVLFGGAIALLPSFVDIYKMPELEYGILRAAPGIGSIITLILLVYLPLNTQPGKKLLWCCAGFGAATIVFGLSHNVVLATIALIFTGMFDAVSGVVRGTILQLVTPQEMRGRVAAVNTMFVSSSNEFGDFESGVMAHWLGTIRAIIVGGCLTLSIVGLIAASSKKLRKFDYGGHC